jgi:hypothetical protein
MNSGIRKLDDELEISDNIVGALESFPITSRLKFVQRLLCLHYGDKQSRPMDPLNVIAAELISGVIKDLEKKRGPRGTAKPKAPDLT